LTKQPVSVRVYFVFIEVDSCDDLRVHKLTSDGHSSTSSHWTVQWPHSGHWYLVDTYYKFNQNVLALLVLRVRLFRHTSVSQLSSPTPNRCAIKTTCYTKKPYCLYF